ncbi:unnamed protein product [Didymodactylos carnosus]|uniref:carbonyl reductase (NADPH) n=1 Tax=Didymodactylos carnosus TaxID=1234261 RepID=A0A815FB71_9BILA|nr:unnamed protein product [Didymodactylos carnosus]CAF1339300.1 unnamed protein product [Didymodactylos carnosus]CAF4150468.1 unnamed protein product [Didymodactylos carnosus]CAF4175942.1 unnamed protein product [Didymodactylos carnosus]
MTSFRRVFIMVSTSTSFKNAVALITGANKGIGFETARQLGEQGIIVLIGARDQNRGEEAVKKLVNENIKAKWIELDVTKQQTVDSAAHIVEEEFGRLDILINNAAVYLEGELPSETQISKMRATFETNFFGAFIVIKAFIPLLKKSQNAGGGCIVNVSSRLASFGNNVEKTRLSYATSKAALNMMTYQFAKEFENEKSNIKINSVNPGLAKTDMNNNNDKYDSPEVAARSIVYFATLPPNGPSGSFYGRDKTQHAW